MSRDASYRVRSEATVVPRTAVVSEGPTLTGGRDFLGYGPIRPFQRDKKTDWASAGGVRLVLSRIGQILGTRAASPSMQGELPWRDDFGSLLHLLRHRGVDETTIELARVYVAQAISRWEPSAYLTDVEVLTEDVDGQRDAAVAIRVAIDIVSRNSPGNAVLLPGVETIVPM
jgi:phage baseplate assembly protein W